MSPLGANGEGRRPLFTATAAVVVVALIAVLVWRVRGGDGGEGVATAPVAAADTTTTALPAGTTASSAPATSEPVATTPTTAATRPPQPTTTPAPVPVPRVAVVGDSSAERLAPGITRWGSATGQLVGVGNAARVGCPMGRGGEMHSAADAIGPVNALCDWATTNAKGMDGTDRPSYPSLVAGWRPTLVVVDAGPWDVADRKLPGQDVWRAVGDPVVDAWLLDEMTAATDLLASGGARVAWLTQPPWEGATRHPPAKLYTPAADPARMRRYNELLLQLAARRPATVRVIDLAGWIASTGEDVRLRPDGAHFEPDTAIEVLDRYLGAELIRAAT